MTATYHYRASIVLSEYCAIILVRPGAESHEDGRKGLIGAGGRKALIGA